MRRREFISALAGAAAMPFVASAQERMRRVYHVAVLIHGPERAQGTRFEALRSGLRELGYIEGQNVSLKVRWNEGGLDRLSDLAADLLREGPDVLVGAPVLSAVAAHKHTRVVPIVIANGSGAVQVGIAKSYARPGGNVTGVVNQGEELTSKQLQLLKTIAPGITSVGVLASGSAIIHDETWREAAGAAAGLNLKLIDVRIRSLGDLPRIETICSQGKCTGLLVMSDPLLQNWRTEIVEAVARQRLPTVYSQPEYVRDGGLISYAANIEERFHRAASYVDRILKGARPGELPIEQPTKFQLVVNAKTAKALSIEIPSLIFAQADEVIE